MTPADRLARLAQSLTEQGQTIMLPSESIPASQGAQAHPDLTEHVGLGLSVSHAHPYAASTHPHNPVHATLANGATAMNLGVNGSVKVTPTANATYTTTMPVAGTRCTILILTSGTTSRTITFGAGFKAVGTLATGTVTNRIFAVSFLSDGTNVYETGRTAAMVA